MTTDAGYSDPAHLASALIRPAERQRPSALAPLLALVLIMAKLTWHAAQPLSNPDTWFHLRIGQDLLAGASLSRPGELSSFATQHWLPTQWSTELLAAEMNHWFGLPGVAWLFGALFLVFVVTVYLVCRVGTSPLPAAVATALTVLAAGPGLSARPQVVSFILLAVTVAAWLRAHRWGAVPWLLIPMTWVWATAHGLWSLGIALSAICWLGVTLDRKLDLHTSLRMLSVPILSLVAACLTPVGPALLGTQLVVGGRSQFISEWQATSFRTLPALALAAMAAVLIFRWSRTGRALWMPLLLLLMACGCAMSADRLVACSAVILAPVLAAELQILVASTSPAARPARIERSVLAVATVGFLVALGLVVPQTAAHASGVPSKFSARLAELPAGSAILVADPVGAWLEWRFQLSPVMDGMVDGYTLNDIKRYNGYQQLQPGWVNFVTNSHARDAVLPADAPVVDGIRTQLGWRIIDRDNRWVYLVAPTEAKTPSP